MYVVWVANNPIQSPWFNSAQLLSVRTSGISADPRWEAEYLPASAGVYILAPPTPLWLAELLFHRLLGSMAQREIIITKVGGRLRLAIWRWRARQLLAAWGRPGGLPAGCSAYSPGARGGEHSSLNMCLDAAQAERLLATLPCLATRRLSGNELIAGWQAAGENVSILPRLLQIMVTAGWLSRIAAVGMDVNLAHLHCRRCGSWRSVRMEHCGRCGSLCPTCDECANLGRLRGCGGLYASIIRPQTDECAQPPLASLQLPFTLTPAQQRASQQLVSAIREKPRLRMLVWAACGAGKTEVTFAAIWQVLRSGGQVLLLAPRRDVVADLCVRLQAVFGEEKVSGLWGGAAANWRNTPVLVATTHQALRLSPAFQLVILDECDAFPYASDQLLVQVVQKLARQATFIQMSATPSPTMLTATRLGAVKLVCIPARHHGWPLPVPQICYDKSFLTWPNKRNGLSQPLPPTLYKAVFKAKEASVPLLLFVPRRSLVPVIVKELTTAGLGRVCGAHAGTANRDEVRQKLLVGEIDVAVVTSIFERGLTFPLVDVAILFADQQRVFNTAALVQMAGRVGRSKQRPTGLVWFLAAGSSPAMQRARQIIVTMNKRARKAGLLNIEA